MKLIVQQMGELLHQIYPLVMVHLNPQDKMWENLELQCVSWKREIQNIKN